MVKTLTTPKWFHIFVTVISLTLLGLQHLTRAAIIQPSPSHLARQRSSGSPTEPASTSTFILLTTGEQIKLHQIVSHLNNWSISGNTFLINSTSSLISLSRPNEPHIKRLGNNTYSRWLAEQAAKPKQTTSILPGDQGYSSSSSGWRKPLIVDVDYFFDDQFCPPAEGVHQSDVVERCLVIVWLDRNNKFVHYGTLNLTEILTSAPSHKTKLVDLHEFPPIDIFKDVELGTDYSPEVHSFAVDKRRLKLYVAFSDGTQPIANKLLSGRFKNFRQAFRSASWARSSFQLGQQAWTPFNDHCGSSDVTLTNTTLKNLNIDEANGKWLFYLDQQASGKIFALGLNQVPSLDESSIELNHQVPPVHALVQNAVSNEGGLEHQANVTCMTLDVDKRRLYWLMDSNTLYSSNLAGLDIQTVGQLSPRPTIRSPSTIQVYHDTLFISDSAKRSLMSYSLETSPSTASLQGRPTHQVMLVDMPTVLGFRLVEITISRSQLIEPSDDLSTSETMPPQGDVMEVKVPPRIQGWLDQLGTYLSESDGSLAQDFNYGAELSARTNMNIHCGYKQEDYTKLVQDQHDKLLLFIIELGILHIAFFVWFVLPWIKHRYYRNSHDTLIRVSSSDLTKCPV